MWVSASDVAKAAIKGLDKDRAVVIPGFSNRVGASFAHHAPRRPLLSMLARQHPALKN
jgi:short-subunit dehydrogenase